MQQPGPPCTAAPPPRGPRQGGRGNFQGQEGKGTMTNKSNPARPVPSLLNPAPSTGSHQPTLPVTMYPPPFRSEEVYVSIILAVVPHH